MLAKLKINISSACFSMAIYRASNNSRKLVVRISIMSNLKDYVTHAFHTRSPQSESLKFYIFIFQEARLYIGESNIHVVFR